MAGCCSSMLQGLLLVVNLIIFGCGVAVLGGGIYMQVEMSNYLMFLDNQAVSTATVLIVIGALITLVSFLGCCGSFTSNGCLMKTYGVLLVILLIAEIGTAIAIYVFKGDIKDIINQGMGEARINYGEDKFPAQTESWDLVQENFHCCGISGYEDWKNVTSLEPNNAVPDSCCIKVEKTCGYKQLPKANDKIYQTGCLDKFEKEINDHAGIAAGIGVGIFVIQLITIIAAFCLGKRMDYESEFA